MDWPIILLGIIRTNWPIILLGMIITSWILPTQRQATTNTRRRIGCSLDGDLDPALRLSPPASPHSLNGTVSPKELIETWRQSIVGLVKLAQENLTSARQWLEAGKHGAAVKCAVTSVENISRALMHCYGEKPELNSGQEEALKLLALRMAGKEKDMFEKTIEDVAQFYHDKKVQRYLSKRNIGFCLFQTKAKTESILDSASRIVVLFAQIIDEYSAAEIPQLQGTCPNCHALDVSAWSFNWGTTSYTCNICKHKWIQPF